MFSSLFRWVWQKAREDSSSGLILRFCFLRVCVPVVRVRCGAWLCVAVRAVREVVVASSSCRSRTVRKYTLDRFFGGCTLQLVLEAREPRGAATDLRLREVYSPCDCSKPAQFAPKARVLILLRYDTSG